MKKIMSVVVATKEVTDELYENFDKQYPHAAVIFVTNEDAKSMAAKYNFGIERSLPYEEGWIVFQHDDARALMSQERLEESLAEIPEDAALIGVAGRTKVPPLSPGFWWHGMGQPGFPGAGHVEHVVPEADPNGNGGRRIASFYGPYPQQVFALDGVWLALDIKTVIDTGVRFDESTFDGYHYYDADFSTEVRSRGLKLWVCDAWISHDSGGESARSASFAVAQQKFIKKWMKRQKDYNK